MVRAVFLYRRDVMGRGMAATDIERGLSTAEVEERIAAGATDDGAPGGRPHYGPEYYGCFVRDLDGHKIEAMAWLADA